MLSSDPLDIVAFPPISGRTGLTDYSYGDSVALELLNNRPGTCRVVYAKAGAFVLQAHQPPDKS
jgi:hypothetical protein